MKPSGKVELLIRTHLPPFHTSWLYLDSSYKCKSSNNVRKSKFLNEKIRDEKQTDDKTGEVLP